jgi:hypothetical protein
MRLLRRAANPPEFDALVRPLLKGCASPLAWGEDARAYYEAIMGVAEAEPSFLVADNGEAVVAVIAEVRDRVIGRFGMTAGFLENSDAPEKLRARAAAEALGELAQVVQRHKPGRVQLTTPSRPSGPETLSHALLSAGYTVEPAFHAMVDLTQEADAIERGFRKGHRAQLKWGRANLSLTVMDAANPDSAMMEAYRQLHAEVAGRVTRPIESWHAARDMVASGNGRLILTHLDGMLVGGTLVMDAADTAYYASSAFRRDQFDKPLGHWPLLRSMQLSREAGRTRFDVGDVTIRPGEDAKVHNIAKFKRGFTNTLMTTLVWTLDARETADV